MTRARVNAVMSVTIEVPVSTTDGDDTLDQLHEKAKTMAEDILRKKLPGDFKVVGEVKFSHALVKAGLL